MNEEEGIVLKMLSTIFIRAILISFYIVYNLNRQSFLAIVPLAFSAP
jgi:hypothetical protein